MKLSAIATTYDWERFGDYCRAIRSLAMQSHDDLEVVCHVEGNEDMRAATDAITHGATVLTTDSDCLAEARNDAAEAASGDAYAFIDDDCVADEDWAARIANALEDGAIAAGGPALPLWPDGDRPWWLPQEFDWLVGAGPYYDDERHVPNTYGCNIAFRASWFDRTGGFDESLGKGTAAGQGEEADLCRRLYAATGKRVRYCPAARVYHYIDAEQCKPTALLRRAYEQGAAKREIGIGAQERSFLEEIAASARDPRHALPAAAYTAATAAGYLHGGRSS